MMIKEPPWFKWVERKKNGPFYEIVGLRKDAPPDVKKSYEEHLKIQKTGLDV